MRPSPFGPHSAHALGREMGVMAARVLRGEDPARLPILYSLPREAGVNLTALAGLRDQWRISPEFVEKASIVVDATGVHKRVAAGRASR